MESAQAEKMDVVHAEPTSDDPVNGPSMHTGDRDYNATYHNNDGQMMSKVVKHLTLT